MPEQTNNPFNFWQELKRRKVVHVVTLYASASFVIIELINNLADPLNLPANLLIIVVIVLAIGFPLTIILSWLFDLTSKGIEKTKSLSEVQKGEKPSFSNAWKIATFVSFSVIIILVVLNLTDNLKQLKAGSIQSLVVLPFANYTGDDKLDYYVDGMHDGLIGNIQKVSALRVISKTSSSTFKDSGMSIPDIAASLNVEAVVETSVMCFGEDSICLQTKVISVYPEEKQLWVSDYKIPKSQILNTISEITRQIANEVKVELTQDEVDIISESRVIDPEAYDAYLKSHQYWGDLSEEPLNKARDYLNSAIEKDPDWAPLYLGLANVWMWLAQQGFEAPSIADSIVYKNLNKALEMDPDLPGAHHLIGWIAFVTEWDWAKAEREFLKALAINPNDAISRIWYAHLLCILQRTNEALPQAQLALDLDPLNPLIQILFSSAQFFTKGCEAAQPYLEELLAIDPYNFSANFILNQAAFRCGDYDKVIASEKHVLQTVMGGQFDEDAYKEIERIFDEQGFFTAYEKILPLYEDLAHNKIITPMDLAIAYTKGNQKDKVMDLIEKGYEIHDHTMPYIAIKAYCFDSLYDNPRFISILRKMNLPLPKK